MVPNLERLILTGCFMLSEINQSITSLEKLVVLNLSQCGGLRKLPKRIKGMSSLEIINLRGCSELRELPEDCGHLQSLKVLDLECSSIRQFPSSIFVNRNLEVRSDEKLFASPSIGESSTINPIIGDCSLRDNLHFLRQLDLSYCNLLDGAFPNSFGDELVFLEELDLSNNPFSVLPPDIKGLSNLKFLNLTHCESLTFLGPDQLPSRLETIRVDYCTSLSSFLDPLEPCQLRCSTYCVDCFELAKRQGGEVTALTLLKRYIQVCSLGTQK